MQYIFIGSLVLTVTPSDPGPAPEPPPELEMPQLLDAPAAAYPEEALRGGIAGTVVLAITLDEQGAVTEVVVTEGPGHGLNEAAVEAARRFRFSPARRFGEPVPAHITYHYTFELPPPPPEPDPVPEPTESLETVVTTQADASRALARSSEAVHVVRTDDAAVYGEDLGEVLTRRSAVMVRREGSLGSRAQVSLGGLGGEQVRFLIDGLPIGLSAFAFGLGNVPVSLARRIEVYNGVVPIRFSADALAGAINIVTEPDLPSTGAALSMLAGSFDTLRGSAGAELFVPRTGLYLRAAGFLDHAANDYAMTAEVTGRGGRVEPARVHRTHDGYDAEGITLDVGLLDRPWAKRLLVRFYASDFFKEIPHNVVMTVPYGEASYRKGSIGGHAKYELDLGDQAGVTAIAGYNQTTSRLDDTATCAYDWYGACGVERPAGGEIGDRPYQQHVTYRTLFGRLLAHWQPAPEHRLELALTTTDDVREGRDRYLARIDAHDPLTTPVRTTTAVGGLAYQLQLFERRLENVLFGKTYLQWASLGSDTRVAADPHREAITAGVGDTLRFAITKRLRLKGSYEWATRLPRAEEYFGDGALIIENPELLPETSHNANLGVELDSLITPVGTFSGSATGMLRLADNLIILLANDQTFTHRNVGQARALGLHLDGAWTSRGEWLHLALNVAWTDARNTSSDGTFGRFAGDRLPNRPYLQASGLARLRYGDMFFPGDALSVEWTTRWVESFFRSWESIGAADTKQVIPPQLLHGAGVTYRVDTEHGALGFSVTAHNVTDEPAFDVVGVPRPGRSFFARFNAEL